MPLLKRRHLGCAAVVTIASACSDDCYTMQSVDASGRFGDTLVAVSGRAEESGTVTVFMGESRYESGPSRYGAIRVNPAGIMDTVTLHRMTLLHDPTRTPVYSAPSNRGLMADTAAFEALFNYLTTQKVLFEIVGKDGSVAKALLNIDDLQGPRRVCVQPT